MTSEKALGLPNLLGCKYTNTELDVIQAELVRYSLSKNESIREPVIKAWILDFQDMNIPAWEVVKRIRMAKQEKKYGVTEFATFMNVGIGNYAEVYKHEKKKEIAEVIPEGVEYVKPIIAHPLLQKDKYEVIYADEKTYFIRNDEDYEIHYPKEYFKSF